MLVNLWLQTNEREKEETYKCRTSTPLICGKIEWHLEQRAALRWLYRGGSCGALWVVRSTPWQKYRTQVGEGVVNKL